MKVEILDKYYLPMNTGEARIFKVIGESESDYMLEHEGALMFIMKDSFQKHAIKVGISTDKLILKKSVDEKIVYVRFAYKETLFDRLYNFYCKKIKKRPDWENYY